MGKTPRENANKQLRKADRFFDLGQYRKAGKVYTAAGELYLKLHDYKIAGDCFHDAAKSFINAENFPLFVESLRYAGEAALSIDDFSEAHQYYKSATKYVSQLKNPSERDHLHILFSALSYLCLFIKGKQDQGLTFLKQVKKDVDPTFFKENPLIKLVKNLTIAIRDKNKDYLDKVESDFEKYKFREPEGILMKKVLVLAKTHISIITNLKLDKKEYTTKEIIKLKLEIDTNPLLEISKYPFYNYNIEEIRIKSTGLTLSDNLTAQKKPDLPFILKPGQKNEYLYEVKPHFQVDNTFIGPILLTCELDGKFIFFLKTQVIKPKLVSPPASLEIFLNNLKTPLINQTFPMDVLVANKGKGEALNISVELVLPEKVKLMRGTTKKQIYSLKANEEMNWEISLKPLEAGDYEIKFNLQFKDPDQNEIEEIKTFPLEIKL